METAEKSAKRTKPKLPAKLSAPRLSSIYARPRLFKLLDEAVTRPVVWVQGPAGAGKTTLIAHWLAERNLPSAWYQLDGGDGDIASFFYYMGQLASHAAPRYKKRLPYLTSEYLAGIPVFSRRYFEDLFHRLKPGSIVVFDNYQEVPFESNFHAVMVHAIEAVPEGMGIVILSRSEPPPALSRIRASNLLHSIGWTDLQFTLDESRALLAMQGWRHSEITLKSIHAMTEGWAAGLILLTARAAAGQEITCSFEHASSADVFDYFASQIFDKLDPSTRQFLMMTAFLPSITVPLAEQLTNNDEARTILERLARHHFFTQKHARDVPSYQYHALFRTFLLAQAQRSFETAEKLSIKRKAAALLRSSGLVEDAALLFTETNDWADLVDLIHAETNSLVSQGRCEVLERWILSVPEDIRNGNASLLYWFAICRMPYNPTESRTLLEISFNQSKKENNAAGAFLSWAAIIDTFNYEWGDFSPLDRWLSEFDELLKVYQQIPSREINEKVAGSVLSAISNRQPGHPDGPEWAQRVRHIILTSQNASLQMMLGNQLIFYYLWIGDFSACAVLMDALRSSRKLNEFDALTKQNWYVMEAMYSWLVADWSTCQQAIHDGLKNADNCGVHLLDFYLLAQGVYGGLSLGAPSAADECLVKMSQINSPRQGDKALFHYQAASVAWYHGDLRKSVEHGKAAVTISEKIGWPFPMALCLVELAVTLYDYGEYDESDACLARSLDIARGLTGLEFLISIAGSRFALERGKKSEGLDFLRRGFAIGARHGFLNTPRWNDTIMARLCATALEYSIEPQYARRLITVRNLAPPKNERMLHDFWPWPIKIFTLGRFEVMCDDNVFDTTDKAYQKPLTLLKLLIACGAKDVPEERITDALWPDAEGDSANRSLKVTLHRLRKLFGRDDIVVVKNSHYKVDNNSIWTDATSFEMMLSELERAIVECKYEDLYTIAKQVVALYRGPFLEADPDPWIKECRARLRGRLLRAISRAVNLLVEYKTPDAIQLLEMVLNSDPHVEGFYEGLMRAYTKVGRTADALSVYRQYTEMMKREFGHPPADALEALRLELQNPITTAE